MRSACMCSTPSLEFMDLLKGEPIFSDMSHREMIICCPWMFSNFNFICSAWACSMQSVTTCVFTNATTITSSNRITPANYLLFMVCFTVFCCNFMSHRVATLEHFQIELRMIAWTHGPPQGRAHLERHVLMRSTWVCSILNLVRINVFNSESPSSATCHIERWSFVALECFRISISFAARGRAQCSQLLLVFLLMQLLLLVVTVLLLLIIYYLWIASLYSVATSCHIEWRL